MKETGGLTDIPARFAMIVNAVQIKIMRLLIIVIAAMLVAAGAGAGSPATPGEIVSEVYPPFIPGQVVLKLSGNSTAQLDPDTISGAELMGRLRSSSVYLLQFDDSVDPLQMCQQLQSTIGVEYAHPNFVLDSTHGVQGSRPISDDEGNYYHQGAANVLELLVTHPLSTGKGIKIGIIDGGVIPEHPVFSKPFAPGYDFVDNDSTAFDEPGGLVSGHGTFVAGLVQLVAPDAVMAPYRVMNADGCGNGFDLARAIEQAVYDDCKVLNISITLVSRHRAVADAISFAESQGVVVVAAAGNNGTFDPVYPAAEEEVLAVAALDTLDERADFSNMGEYIDFCAPGVNLYSSYASSPDSLYAWWSGTSFATPLVAGQAALIAEILPLGTVQELRLIMSLNAEPMDVPMLVEGQIWGYALIGGLIHTYDAVVDAIIKAVSERPTDPLAYATATPSQFHFSACRSCNLGFLIRPLIYSSNAPALFYVESLSKGITFTSIESPVGFTNDVAVILAHSDVLRELGTYVDSVAIYVEGVKDPVIVEIFLEIVPITAAAHTEPNSISLEVDYGDNDIQHVFIEVTSTNQPAPYECYVKGGPGSFVSIPDSTGVTPDKLHFMVDPGGIKPGTYTDTIVISVFECESPVFFPVELIVKPGMQESCLVGNSPNPFNPSTTIFFRLETVAEVDLRIYNVLGQEVACLISGQCEAGEHQVTWTGTDKRGNAVGSGVYFYRLKSGQEVQTRKMMLIK